MKMDALIKKRFAELDEKGRNINPEISRTFYVGMTLSELNHDWLISVLNLLQRAFGEDSVHYKNFDEQYKAYLYSGEMGALRGIFRAAKEDYEGGYLFNVRALVTAEVLDDFLEHATELLRANHKDPACVVAGIALESSLKELCTSQSIVHGKLETMNVELCKAGVYNMAMQKQVTAWAARRNDAAHGKWGAYTAADVDDLIKGVTRFIAEYL
jgi:hypothetical protein